MLGFLWPVVAAVLAAFSTAADLASAEQWRLGPERLNVAYLQCAVDHGFDPEVVQVIVQGDRPVAVKAGYEVPARVHRPCLMQIGGTDPGAVSSYGR